MPMKNLSVRLGKERVKLLVSKVLGHLNADSFWSGIDKGVNSSSCSLSKMVGKQDF